MGKRATVVQLLETGPEAVEKSDVHGGKLEEKEELPGQDFRA